MNERLASATVAFGSVRRNVRHSCCRNQKTRIFDTSEVVQKNKEELWEALFHGGRELGASPVHWLCTATLLVVVVKRSNI
jgi:hypothetical protein